MIVWYVNNVDPWLASFRYRAVWMARALASLDRQCMVTDDPKIIGLSKETDALVFAKSFSDTAFRLAWDAKKAEVPIILDLCDNIFISGYLGSHKGARIDSNFYGMCKLASAVVVPTEKLREVVLTHSAANTEVFVIPDGVESEQDVRGLVKKLNNSDEARINIKSNLLIYRKKSVSCLSGYAHEIGLKSHPLKEIARKIGTAWKNPEVILPYIKRKLGWEKKALRKALSDPMDKPMDMPSKQRGKSTAKSEEKTVLWFGNAGGVHGNYGIATILRAKRALIELSKELPMRLVVVSNDKSKYGEYIRPLPFKNGFIEWNPISIFKHVKNADVVILPNSGDEFSQTKSANRVIFSLMQNTPVVTESFPALSELKDAVVVDDWERGLKRYLLEGRVEDHISLGKRLIEKNYSDEALSRKWESVLQYIEVKDLRRKKTVLIVLDLIQDLEVVKPVIRHLCGKKNYRVKVLVSQWLIVESPRVKTFLDASEVELVINERKNILKMKAATLQNVDVILFPSESNLGPHRVAHHIAKLAKSIGIKTITFQHGLENIGLTYFDGKKVDFASDIIVTWSDIVTQSTQMDPSVRLKCKSIGMFKEVSSGPAKDILQTKLECSRVIGVFENLHWDRYSDFYREKFLACVINTAKLCPQICFLVKTHHAGKWLQRNIRHKLEEKNWPDNIEVIDIEDPFWERYTGNQLVAVCDAVITTPSTIAVDASLSGVPTAVVGNDISEMDVYSPLVTLKSEADWLGFVDQVFSNPNSIIKRVNEFNKKVIKQVNPCEDFEMLLMSENDAV